MSTSDTVRQFIEKQLVSDGRVVADSDLLVEEGIIDSFGIMSLLGFLEEQFAIQIGGDELLPENFQSIAAITALVERKTGR